MCITCILSDFSSLVCLGLLGGCLCCQSGLDSSSCPWPRSVDQDEYDKYGYFYCVDNCFFMIFDSDSFDERVFTTLRNWTKSFDELFIYSSFPTAFWQTLIKM